MNVLEKILEEMKKIKEGSRKEKLYAKYPPQDKRQEILNAYSQGYEDGTDNFYNAIIPIIRSHINGVPDMDNGWVSVEEKLPEARTTVLACFDNGDVESLWQDWEENVENLKYFELGDEEKDGGIKEVIAWQPLPEPYKEGK